MKKLVILAMILALSGCTTMVTVSSNPQGATIYMSGVPKGVTPYTQELSDFVFTTYPIRLEKEGYLTLNDKLKKEIKWDATLGGFIFVYPWLWAYGPQDYQIFNLIPDGSGSNQTSQSGDGNQEQTITIIINTDKDDE